MLSYIDLFKINKFPKTANKSQLIGNEIHNCAQDIQKQDLQICGERALQRPDALYRMAAFGAAAICKPVFENAVTIPPDQ